MEQTSRKMSFGYLIVWGIAAFGSGLISNCYAGMLTIFYQDYMGVESKFIQIVALVYAVINAVNDPIVGYLSDSSRSRKGRRIPFMRYTAPFLGLTFFLVWLVPPTSTQIIKFLWMLITTALYDTAYTIVGLIYSALLPEITESDRQRGLLSTSSSIFSLLGVVFGFLLPDIFRQGVSGSNYASIYIGMGIVAILGTIFVLLTTFFIKERLEFVRIDTPVSLKAALKYTFVNRSFIILVLANLMQILMQSLLLGTLFYLADYVLGWSGIGTMAIVLVGLIIGIFLTNVFIRRLGVVLTQQILLVIAGCCLALIPFVPIAIIYPLLFIAGFGLSGPQVLTNVLFAQVCDEDELKSGVRREAMFFGVNALITKPAQSLALILTTAILDLTGFVKRIGGDPQPQTDFAKDGIKVLIGLIPGIAILIGALILLAFPLRGSYLKEVQQKILVLHQEKRAKLDALQEK